MPEPTTDNVIAQRILQAGITLFARRGYAATSIREIADAAGITKPMLYYYFDSKEGLCRAALGHYLEEIRTRVDHVFDDDVLPENRLLEIACAHFNFFAENPDFCRLAIVFIFGPQEEVPGLNLHDFGRKIRENFVRAAADACSVGQARPGCEESLARALSGMLQIWTFESMKNPDVKLTRPMAAQMIRDLLYGFRSPIIEPEAGADGPDAPLARCIYPDRGKLE